MGYRGKKHHLKRVHAPHHWNLKKMGGNFAPRPSPGPHKLRECVPLAVLLRNKLKYALTYNEVKLIVMQGLIRVDSKLRKDIKFPLGFQDVVQIDKTGEHFRMLYDTKGRFRAHRIEQKEAKFKLCRIRRVFIGPNAVPYAVTHDGRTIRYAHPNIKPYDTVKFEVETGKITDIIKFEHNSVAMITGGNNVGRIGVVLDRERHFGSIEIVHVRDSVGNTFATRIGNVFLIGKSGESPLISLPKNSGIKLSIQEDRKIKLEKRLGKK